MLNMGHLHHGSPRPELSWPEMAGQTEAGQENEQEQKGHKPSAESRCAEAETGYRMEGAKPCPSLPEAGRCWLDRGSVIGAAIRDDVRAAVGKIWIVACRRTRAAMGDPADTTTMMEVAVVRASQYLDRLNQEASVERAGAVLMKIFTRQLRRQATRLARLQPAGRDIEFTASIPSWEDGVNAGIFLEQLERHMSREGVTILTLRRDGHSWQEISQMLQTTVTAVKKRFWREIEDAKISLGIQPQKAQSDRTKTRRGGKRSAA